MALGSVEVEVFQFILRRAESPQRNAGLLFCFFSWLQTLQLAAPKKNPRKTNPETPENNTNYLQSF